MISSLFYEHKNVAITTTHSYTQYLLFLTIYTALNRSIKVLMYQYIECIPNAYNDFVLTPSSHEYFEQD